MILHKITFNGVALHCISLEEGRMWAGNMSAAGDKWTLNVEHRLCHRHEIAFHNKYSVLCILLSFMFGEFGKRSS